MTIKNCRKCIWTLISFFLLLNARGQTPAANPSAPDGPSSNIPTAKTPAANQLAPNPPAANIPTRDTDHVSPSQYVVGNIVITGNKKTKNYIILRELSFKTGDSISIAQLVKAFQLGHDRLFNTRLFNEVIIFCKGFRGYIVDVEIDVKERWYIFPLPYFKPVDRNLTAWAQKNYNLNRVNYGGKFTHYNFTGRNDQLTAWLITGYARQIQVYYNQPYADKSLKHGFGLGFTYAQQKELDAFTLNNQQGFINSDTIGYSGKYLTETFTASARYFYRPGLKVRHLLSASWSTAKIDSAVTVWNPRYFNNDRRFISYPELSYRLNYTDIDYVAYPLKGFMFETGLTRKGLDRNMNIWLLSAKFTKSWQLGRKWWFGIQNNSVLKLPLHQPFFNQQLIGYNDMYLRGLDRYVVDGTAGTVLRNTLFRELFNFDIPFVRHTSHDHIPIRIYATAFSDYGYAYNHDFTNNSLVNRGLYTAGFGLDLVTFYDINFRFDYGFNQLGQNGLFLHIRNDF